MYKNPSAKKLAAATKMLTAATMLSCWLPVWAQDTASALQSAQSGKMHQIAESKNSYGGPKLEIPSNVIKLNIVYDDAQSWGDRRIDPKMQCGRNGGDKPASPKMLIEGAPDSTSSLVVYILNEPPSWDNHGLFRVLPHSKKQSESAAWVVPSIGNNRDLDKLPQRIQPYAGGNSWGRVYSAPCPSGGSWRYTVSVFALDAEDKVVGHAKTMMGYAP